MQFWTLDEIDQHATADHEVDEEISPGVTGKQSPHGSSEGVGRAGPSPSARAPAPNHRP